MSTCNGACCEYHVLCCFCDTKQVDNWSKSLRNVPKVKPVTWAEWLEKGGKKNTGDKSYKFFRESYVHDIYIGYKEPCDNDSKKFVMKARCYRSLKKNEQPHFLQIVIEEKERRAAVIRAHCSCKAGSGGHCNHTFALLFQINDYCCSDVKDIPSDASCTSLAQTWHIPRAPSICPLPVMSTHYAKAKTDENRKRKRDPVRCKLYDARGSTAQFGFPMVHVMSQVSHLKQKEKPPPFAYLLSDQEPAMQINTVFGNVPLGSCLSYQLQDFGRPNPRFITNFETVITDNAKRLKCVEFPDVPMLDQEMGLFDINQFVSNCEHRDIAKEYLSRNVVIGLASARNLEKRTVLQGDCSEWLSEHQHRITASVFGTILFRKKSPSQSMLLNMFAPKDLSNVKAIAHGKTKEKVARTIYSKQMQRNLPNFQVYDAGLSVSPVLPYLGATPDGKVFDPCVESPYGLLEIKCPYSKRDCTLEQAASDSGFYLERKDDVFCLKKEHNCGYYAQIQGQLALTGLKWCDFCVYLSESNEICVDRICFDSKYWSETLLPKLSNFYLQYALPFLINKLQC